MVYTEWPKKMYTLFTHQIETEIEISFKFIPKILMSKECIHFLGHSVCQGDMFRPSRSSSGTPLGGPEDDLHIALTYIPLYIKINVVLLTDVLYS